MRVERLVWWSVLALALSTAPACSKQRKVLASSSSVASPGQLPFKLLPANQGPTPSSHFRATEIPAGSPIVIRLKSAVSSAHVHPDDSFEAVLDVPITVEGQTCVPRGATVIGRVVDVKPAGEFNDAGYLRLTLVSITVSGHVIPLQTSSIFAKGRGDNRALVSANGENRGSESSSGADVTVISRGDPRFSTGRQLTFRLAQAVQLRG